MGRRLNLKTAAPGRPIVSVGSPAARWRRRLLGALRFLGEVPASNVWPLDKWAAGMRVYYRDQVTSLLANPPKGCKPEAARYAAQFRRVLDSRNKT